MKIMSGSDRGPREVGVTSGNYREGVLARKNYWTVLKLVSAGGEMVQ